MKFKHFFWDFDGTLFDTYPRVNRAIQKALKDVGVEASLEAIAPLSKVTVQHAVRTLAPQHAEEAGARYFAHAEEEGYETMRPYPGVLRLLQSICEHGGRNYLYTHRDKTGLNALRHYGLADYFPLKPAPDALLHLMKKHGLQPDQCVMLGDRDIDLNSGLNAGMAGALFDPEHYYDDFKTPYRYAAMFDLMADLVWEQSALNLHVSDMLALQQALQDQHPEWGGNHPGQGTGQLLWLVGELGEVIDVIKKVDNDHLMADGTPRAMLVEELTDVAMYFHDILNCYGITAEEFSQAYYSKMQRNLHRNYSAEHKDRYGV